MRMNPDQGGANEHRVSFLASLRRNQKGNALAITAAAVIPLLGAVGGGVDLTRAYMAEARLAQACDAAALAGRKVMTNDDVSEGSDAIAEIDKFMDYNFPEGIFDSATIKRTVSVSDTGELRIRLASSIPTSLLRIVDISSIAINADCSARRSGTNVDVVLVLDVTGSMAWDIDKDYGSSNERMTALQNSAKLFLDILKDLETQLAVSGLRVRVGVVPYSQSVNIGKQLYKEDPAYIDYTAEPYATDLGAAYLDTRTVESGNGKKKTTTTEYKWAMKSVSGAFELVNLSLDQFVENGLAETTYSNPYAWKGCVEARSTVTTINSGNDPFITVPAGAWDVIDAAPGETVNGLTAPKWRPFFASPYKTSNIYGPDQSGANMSLARLPWSAIHWDISSNWGTNSSPPKTYKNKVSSTASSSGPNTGCPSDEAQLLSELDDETVASLKAFIGGFTPLGGTYHDVGMYWGLALISPDLPFKNDPTWISPDVGGAPVGVNRYIVFMSDGNMQPTTSYTSYGKYAWEHRTKSNTNTPTEEHRARYRMICQQAKQQGIEISTIAFAKSIGNDDKAALKGCASSNQYYTAETSDQLNDVFKKIAQNIGYLRISK